MSTSPTLQPDTTPAPASAPVTDRSTKPKGVIPKNLQSWVWIGGLLLIAVGIFFSGTGPKRVAAGTANTPAPAQAVGGLTPDQVSKRLQDSEAAARATLPGNPRSPQGQLSQQSLAGDPQSNPDAAFLATNPPTAPPNTPDPVDQEERKRDYLSRYASNVALSYRTGPHPQTPSSPLAPPTGDSADPANPALSGLAADFKQQLQNLQSQQQQLLSAAQQQLAGLPSTPSSPAQPNTSLSQSDTHAAPTNASNNDRKITTLNNSSNGKNHIIFEGTLLETVLVNRLNGDFAGPVVCQVTTDLYSHDHSTLLIPAGTRALGETRKVDSFGQTRLAVIFHRLIMPDGYAVDLDLAPALNQIGETALNDKVNNHYFKIFGASIAVGALADSSEIDQHSSAKPISVPVIPIRGSERSDAGDVDCGGSDRNRQGTFHPQRSGGRV